MGESEGVRFFVERLYRAHWDGSTGVVLTAAQRP